MLSLKFIVEDLVLVEKLLLSSPEQRRILLAEVQAQLPAVEGPSLLRWKFKVTGQQPSLEFGCIPASLQVGAELCTHAPQPWLQHRLPMLRCLQDNQGALHTLALSTCNQRPVGIRSAVTVSHLPPQSVQLLGIASACAMPASQLPCLQVGSALQQEVQVVNGTEVELLLRRGQLSLIITQPGGWVQGPQQGAGADSSCACQ
jgi:hypothetical protein